MEWDKFIASVIALFASFLYVSNMITSLTTDPIVSLAKDEPNQENVFEKFAKFRLILSIIMSLSWGYLIAC